MEDTARRQAESVTERRAQLLGIAYFDTSLFTDKALFPGTLTPDEMRSMRVIPIDVRESTIFFGITTNTSQNTLNGLEQRFQDQRLSFAIISDQGFDEYISLYDPPEQVIYQDITISDQNTDDLVNQISDTLAQVRGDDILAYLVKQAHQLKASDIHLETSNDGARIRFRIDGVLHTIARLPLDKYRILLSSIASAGNISTGSTEAQQGHITRRYMMEDGNTVDVNIRLETVPTIHGIDAVMRMFNMSQELYDIDNLGLAPSDREAVDEIIARPSGLVLVVGPTGSGKTTTLYSLLNSLNNDERKIITIEDPVEYQFNGITQISVNSKSTQEQGFAERLRAVLRLDPDIVMVGEIRDLDTAKTALQASLTGHLVMSTFHASSACAALTRLMDVIGENPLYLTAVRLVMAQRLVRKLDDSSKIPYEPDEPLAEQLRRIVASLPEWLEKPDMTTITLYRPGKSADAPFGYKGQLAIREQLVMTDGLRQVLSDPTKRYSVQEMERVAQMNGMVTMLQDAVLKAIAGETSMDEVYRVIG